MGQPIGKTNKAKEKKTRGATKYCLGRYREDGEMIGPRGSKKEEVQGFIKEGTDDDESDRENRVAGRRT
jgi:hypothetical protein